MNAPEYNADWSAANQGLLVAEFARLKALLADEDPDAAHQGIESCRATLEIPAAVDQLQRLFGLSNFERDLLLLCAGVEMDTRLGELCSQGGRGAWPSFGMALASLPDPHWSALTPVRPLRRWRLLEIDERENIANARLRIDERILHYLAGINYLDTRLRPLLQELRPPATLAETHEHARETILASLRQPTPDDSAVFLLHGDDPDGQADIAAATAAALGLGLYGIRAADLPQNASELDAFALLWQREGALLDSALLIRIDEAEQSANVVRLSGLLAGLCFVASADPVALERHALSLGVDKPDARAQRELWTRALGPAAKRLNGSLGGVAVQFRFSTRTILGESERLRSAVQCANDPDQALWQACRDLARNRLGELAQHITPRADWSDLVLPDAQLSLLQQIATQVRQRLKVHQDWGFAGKGMHGLGIAALFAGDSGTGKTLAAEVLANELHLDLYRIDLASVVSKYIGETERNLKRVFDAGEESGAILLFDEADALFGKRSEVKDAHDRYANIEVSYLLQRMEAYSGLAILTTNHKAALDPAFQRRLRFIVQFPFPDKAQRERIWRGIFPDDMPRESIDYGKLARLNVAGGTIRNIALTSAFLAAEENEPLGMRQLLRSAHLEAAKRNKPYSDSETRGWV